MQDSQHTSITVSDVALKDLFTYCNTPKESNPKATQLNELSRFSWIFQLSAENLNVCNEVSTLNDLEYTLFTWLFKDQQLPHQLLKVPLTSGDV